MQFIDSHAHINSEEFTHNWFHIVQNAVSAGVTTIINNASDLTNTKWGIEQANQSPHIYTTAGIHPEVFLESNQSITQSDFNNLRRLIEQSKKVVAIGEIGLDYTLDLEAASKTKQFNLIEPQIQLAIDLKLPLTLHVRDLPGRTECFTDLLGILKNFYDSPSPVTRHPSQNLNGVFHCWVGTPDQAEQALDLGFYLSFSGILTYKSAGHITDVAAMAPSHRILIETDAPYLTPEPARSKLKPPVNLPEYVIMTAEKLADIRRTTLQEIAEITSQNAQRLFSLPQND